ncbi:transglycosylase SLT domain-containing protein [Streptomyces sp. NBC_00250]|uniref:transglycosylase SLT domain-containing protein n=1 Tax=Streptomyces sp. NBC_00250 TaxID=2903641 RepID=UPI002E2D5AB1|nr:transglycosylase SLT domain-containing protein [Streptomyces sp. NBC_00250]
MLKHLRTPRRRLTAQVAATAVLASSIALIPFAAPTTPAEAADATTNVLFGAPEKALGKEYRNSGDQIVSGTGDSEGFHIVAASEREGYTFREVASLRRKDVDAGPWTGYVCTTGSGKYAAAVYMPSLWTNKPGAVYRGAFAAVVRLSDGKVTEVAQGVHLSYYSPGCGEDDRVLFSTSSATDAGPGKTTVIEADAATGKATADRTVDGQLTHMLPTPRGDYGVLNGDLVKLTGRGKTTRAQKQTKLDGPVFALTSSAGGDLDLGHVKGRKSVISRWHGGKLSALGSGEIGKVKLFPRKGGSLVVGDVAEMDTSRAPGLKAQPFTGRPEAVSREGRLIATSVVSDELKGVRAPLGTPESKATEDGLAAGLIRLQATAVATGTKAAIAFDTDAHPVEKPASSAGSPAMGPAAHTVSGPVASGAVALGATADPRDDVEPLSCGEGSPEALCLSAGVETYEHPVVRGDPEDESDPFYEIPCLVKRNDPKRQAQQPSANQVEWAVDQAVHGALTLQRPANWHDTGLPAYSPQGLFPKPGLTGGGDIPAQVVLGILAQESNFKQASWHSVNGTAGNVLQADWFGNGASIHYYPNWRDSDCGYGIAQVTTGMSERHAETFNPTEAGAIATDYATNIAAGMQILAEKWNQLKALGMETNDGSPQWVENWYMALWGYNSGVYTDPTKPRGLGFFNNPANATYPPDRQGFLRATFDDAAHPAKWPYQEKVLGWAETPHKTWNWEPSYMVADFPGATALLNLPTNYGMFCSPSINNCTPGTANPCPPMNESCRWAGSASWIPGQSESNSSREQLRFPVGSPESELVAKYPSGPCMTTPDGTPGTIVIDDLNGRENVYGCGAVPNADQGKFSLQFGDNLIVDRGNKNFRASPYIAQIDVHQLGAGYNGHVFFTHSYPTADFFHKVTGRWKLNPALLPGPDQPGRRFNVWIHLPNHGAEATVRYTTIPGPNKGGLGTDTCNISQANRTLGKNSWFKLGSWQFWKGGGVEMDNVHPSGGTGDANVAFDAVAFVPVGAPDKGNCNMGK